MPKHRKLQILETMKHKLTLLLVFLNLFLFESFSQPFATITSNEITFDNGVIKRVISLKSTNGIVSTFFSVKEDSANFLTTATSEFSFIVNGKEVNGFDKWQVLSAKPIDDPSGGNGVLLVLKHPEITLQISVTYLLYKNLPFIRKKIAFINTGNKDLNLEGLNTERISIASMNTGTECWVLQNYARQKSLGLFEGNWYDPLVVVYDNRYNRGVVLGNEAPGVMKRTTAFLKPDELTIGLTMPQQNFCFRKWLKSKETWESPWAFTGLYKGSDPSVILNGPVNDFVRRHLGTRLSAIPEKPVFVYNTWEPFWHNINEKMMYELIDAAAECGAEEFVIDDGWQSSYGDWGINKEKFPNGLKPVFDYIKSKGMKPGVWISLAAAESVSKVYKEHPEWLVRKTDGSPINLHADTDKMYDWESYSMCMTTGWRDYIKGVILKMVKEYGLEYIKADFAAVSGAYTTDKTRSGCHAKNHSHRDRPESMLEMYRATWQLFDELHQEAPNLFIDCTFETMGALQLIDFDMCKHAEGNWLSNFCETAPLGTLRVRQMAWWRSPVIPATAMVIGNQRLDDPEFLYSLKSLSGTLPIVLGDPRQLSTDKRKEINSWASWLRAMQTKHDFMSYRQDLTGFGEPMEGGWDGFQRINSETQSGGIVGVFRHGAMETHRNVHVKYLNPNAAYEVKQAPDGKTVFSSNGEELMKKGFTVTLEKSFDGAVFEISQK